LNGTEAAPVLWPLVVYLISALGLAGAMIGLSYVLGERQNDSDKGVPFESGIEPTGSARVRVNAQFYLIAMFFVIFDMETVFIVAWAVAVRQLGWLGYIAAMTFLFILVVGLVYEWRLGALDWGPLPERVRRRLKGARLEPLSASPQATGED
jgi:NADH-quinone oxidoreductase subunit A